MSELLSIPLISIPGFSKLVAAYLNASPDIRPLYKYEMDISSFERIMLEKSTDDTDRQLLVEVLKRQYQGIEMNSNVSVNIDSLLSKDTYTITAAHQPCLLMGPVFNIYKIASTINLCLQLKEKYPSKHFVPVFWMGSEDHDFEELNQTYINGHKVEWTRKEGEGGAFGRRKLDGLIELFDETLKLLGDKSIAEIDCLKAGLSQFNTFATYTRYVIHHLFSSYGLVVLDQDDKQLKKRFAPIIRDELERGSADNILKPNLKFLASNYNVQATPREINLFYLSANSRERIIKTDLGYEVNNTGIKFTIEELISLSQKHPEYFSPNVILRPIYQELILPNLAFIGGAGELSYWLELKPLFEYHQINYPMLVMRASFTIINNYIDKKMNKLELLPSAYYSEINTLIKNYLRAKLGDDINLSNEKKVLAEVYDALALKAEKTDPTLKGSVLAEKQKQILALENLELKILKAWKRKESESTAQIKTIKDVFTPLNIWQERIDNYLNFSLKNPMFINGIVANANPFNRTMQLLNLDSIV